MPGGGGRGGGLIGGRARAEEGEGNAGGCTAAILQPLPTIPDDGVLDKVPGGGGKGRERADTGVVTP